MEFDKSVGDEESKFDPEHDHENMFLHINSDFN